MSISGHLEEIQVTELLQMFDRGGRTGLLTFRCSKVGSSHYLWFREGRIVAAADRRDGQGLIQLIRQKEWLSDRVLAKMLDFTDPSLPLGTRLHSQGALASKQVKQLFFLQVMQQIYHLLKVRAGKYRFTPKKLPPASEVTGLSKPAIELTFVGLRSLKNWHALSEHLPLATSALARLAPDASGLLLNKNERSLWERADGCTSLAQLSERVALPVERARQIAFCLHLAGLVEEVSAVACQAGCHVSPLSRHALDNSQVAHLSHSFFEALSSFLHRKLAAL